MATFARLTLLGKVPVKKCFYTKIGPHVCVFIKIVRRIFFVKFYTKFEQIFAKFHKLPQNFGNYFKKFDLFPIKQGTQLTICFYGWIAWRDWSLSWGS